MPCPSLFTVLSGIRSTLGSFLTRLRIEGGADLGRALGIELGELGLDLGVALDVGRADSALRLGGLLLALEGRADFGGLLGVEILEFRRSGLTLVLARLLRLGSLGRLRRERQPLMRASFSGSVPANRSSKSVICVGSIPETFGFICLMASGWSAAYSVSATFAARARLASASLGGLLTGSLLSRRDNGHRLRLGKLVELAAEVDGNSLDRDAEQVVDLVLEHESCRGNCR